MRKSTLELLAYYNQSAVDYEPVEYIELDGTQYYDTGRAKTSADGVEISYQYTSPTSPSRVYGDRSNASYGYMVTRWTSAVDAVTTIGWGPAWVPDGNHTSPMPGTARTTVSIMNGKLAVTVGATEYTATLPDTVFTTAGHVLIGGGRSGNQTVTPAKCRIFYCIETDASGNVTADYIPVLDSAGRPCLYDLVGRTFLQHVNTSGSTVPTYKRYTGFVRKDYLKSASSAGAYIDTGVVDTDGNLKAEFRFKYETWVSYGFIFGNHKNETSRSFRLLLQNSDNSNGYATGGTNSNQSISIGGMTRDQWHTGSLELLKCSIDGTEYTRSATAVGAANSNSLLLFRSTNTSTSPVVSLAYFKLWKGSTLIRSYLPVIVNGQATMYDECHNKVCDNAGSGAFTAG